MCLEACAGPTGKFLPTPEAPQHQKEGQVCTPRRTFLLDAPHGSTAVPGCSMRAHPCELVFGVMWMLLVLTVEQFAKKTLVHGIHKIQRVCYQLNRKCSTAPAHARGLRTLLFRLVFCQVFAVKTWGELASYDGYGGAVTGVKFGKSASFLVRKQSTCRPEFQTVF